MTADRASRICASVVPGATWHVEMIAGAGLYATFALRATFPDARTACIFTDRMSGSHLSYLHECAEVSRLATELAECWVDGKVRA